MNLTTPFGVVTALGLAVASVPQSGPTATPPPSTDFRLLDFTREKTTMEIHW